MRWASRSSPKASRPRRRASCCARWDACTARAIAMRGQSPCSTGWRADETRHRHFSLTTPGLHPLRSTTEERAMRRSRTLIPALVCLAVGTAAAQQAATPTPPEQRTTEEQKTMPPLDARWSRLDADRDGRISPVEADRDSAFGLTFDDMDSDDDGFVSNAEFVAFGDATATRSASQDTATDAGDAAADDGTMT